MQTSSTDKEQPHCHARRASGIRPWLRSTIIILFLLSGATALQSASPASEPALRNNDGKPLFLVNAVSDIPGAGGHTYEFWFTNACVPDFTVDQSCRCQASNPDNNDCIATIDTDSDNRPDTAQDTDGDGIFDLVDLDYTVRYDPVTKWDVIESLPLALQDILNVYVVTWGLKTPFWDTFFNRDVHILDLEDGTGGLAHRDGSHFDINTGSALKWAPGPRSIMAHETWHMTQYAYNAVSGVPPWFVEGQAKHAQDMVFADLDDDPAGDLIGAARNYLKDPNYPVDFDLDDDGVPEATNVPVGLLGASYDAALFWKYLTEQAGTSLSGQPGEGIDFLEEVLEMSDQPVRFSGQLATSLVLSTRLGRTFDLMFWDFTIANYAKGYDLSLLDPATIDGRDPQSTLAYRDDDITAYRTVTRTTFSADETFFIQQGRVDAVEHAFFSTGPGKLGMSASGEMPPYGVKYFEATLPNSVDCPVVFWEVFGDPGAQLLNSFMIVQDDTNGDNKDEIVDLVRHNGDSFSATAINPDGATDYIKVAAIVATLGEPEGFDWRLGCSVPTLAIVEPDEENQAAVGLPENPGNFQLWVKVLDFVTDEAIGGLDATRDFIVTVGGDSAQILTGEYVQDQYWMVVAAPEKPGAPQGSIFDVEVELITGNADDTQDKAVVYDLIPHDYVLVIDRSGSMSQQGKLGSAQAAARIYASATNQEDYLGVASFSDDARTDFALTHVPDQDDLSVTPGVRAQAHAAINGLTTANQTSIGDGLLKARDMLNLDGVPSHEWVMVLLSDGFENRSLLWSQVQNDIIATGADVHAITLGSQADPDLMNEIARLTCSERRIEQCFWVLGDDSQPVAAASVSETLSESISAASVAAAGDLTNNLADIYMRIAETASGRQRLWQGDPSSSGGIQFEIKDDGVREAIFAFNWRNPAAPLNVTISGPAGLNLIPRDDGMTHQVFYAAQLPLGVYTLNLTGGGNDWTGSVSAIIEDGVQLYPVFDNTVGERVLGEAAHLYVALVDGNGPSTGATVTALVTRPDGSQETISLRDDGAAPHDSHPNDGIYGYAYDRINELEFHNYAFDISASGDGFNRYKRVTYRPVNTSIPDGNGDELFDNWQQRYQVLGKNQDPDRDDLTNYQEMQLGTNPVRADSDHGGELDGSEVQQGRNPLDGSDDAIGPLVDHFVENEPGQVLIYFSPRPEYENIRVFRRDGIGPFNSLGDFPAKSGLFVDTGVVNDKEYLYLLQPLGRGARGAYSRLLLAEPAADPYPPEAEVYINDNAAVTDDTRVTLQLQSALLADGTPEITHMQVSNTGDFGRTPWRPYTTTLAWRLDPDPETGVAFVHVRHRDAAGNVSRYIQSDGILYDPGHAQEPEPMVGADDDTLEAGAWWVGDYPPAGPGGPDLPKASGYALDLQSTLAAASVNAAGAERITAPTMTGPWQSLFALGDEQASVLHWLPTESGGVQDEFVESGDLAYFIGQGRPQGVGFLDEEGGIDILRAADLQGGFGDQDLDWVAVDAGRVLGPLSASRWAGTMHGLRLFLGFATARADVAQAPLFARYLRMGYTLTQAWFRAVDASQPDGVVAAILAEKPDYLSDRQTDHNAETAVDEQVCLLQHSTGDGLARQITRNQIDALPIIPVPALTEQEAQAWFAQLAGHFAINPDAPIQIEQSGLIFSADGQLELDTRTGVYQYTATDDLWLWRKALTDDRALTAQEARATADQFLQEAGLLPADMHFWQVETDRLRCGRKGGALGAAQPLVHQVIYTRLIEVTPPDRSPVQIPVLGLGGSVRVYVKAVAPNDAEPAELVVGLSGVPVAATGQAGMLQAATTIADTPLMEAAQAAALALDSTLAEDLALAPLTLDDVTQSTLLAHNLAYWRGASGFNQDALIPVYRMLIGVEFEDGSTINTPILLPASAAYLPPLARIERVRTQAGALVSDRVAANTPLVLTALDAATPLNQAGYDESLALILGSGEADSYTYAWYAGEVSESTGLGSGREITYTPIANGSLTLILEVTDTAVARDNNRSYASVELSVGETTETQTYLPTIQR